MKKIIIMLALPVVLMMLAGCNDFLDESPRDRIDADEAFATRNDLYLNAVAAIYRDVGGSSESQGLQGTARGVYDLNTFSTDEAIIPTRGADWYDGGMWQNLFLHHWSGVDPIGDAWNYLFKEVLACNGSLERIEAFATAHPGEDVSDMRAEVRALRAMFYFYAMDLYGRVPLFTASSPSLDDLQLQPRSMVFRYIVSELQAVTPLLTAQHTNHKGEYYGRFNRAAAYFLLAKLMLNSEVYADDDWTDDVRPQGASMAWNIAGTMLNSWQATEYYCDCIEALGYSLESSFAANFGVNNEPSVENIFTIPMDKYLYETQFVNLFRSRHYNHAAALGLNGENGPCATIEALNTFGYGTGDVDPRFELTYYADAVYDLHGNEVTLDDGTPLVYYPRAVELDLSNSPYEKTAGARMAKYEVDATALKDGKLSDNDIVLFRYADVLLMRAEARMRDGRDGSADFDAVRARVGAPQRDCTLTTLLDERLLELAWEGWRRNDMIRFGTFGNARTSRPQLDADVHGYTTVYPVNGDMLSLTGDTQNPGY